MANAKEIIIETSKARVLRMRTEARAKQREVDLPAAMNLDLSK